MAARGDRDEAWFTDVYRAHYPAVARYGLRRLGDVDVAKELAQDVFVVLWRWRYDVPDHALPWLYGVARRPVAIHEMAWRDSVG
jgi:DNA-directed RNA polymerase specialized sigma24 family protein